MTLSLLAVGLAFMVGPGAAQKWLVLLALMNFIAFRGEHWGHWLVLISEIYPTTLRGRAMSIPSAAHWLFNVVVSFSFLPLIHHLGNGLTFGLFALSA